MNTIKVNKKPTVTPTTGMKVTGLDKEGKVVNFDYDDLEKQRDAYRGAVADTDPVPSDLRNGDYVRCKGDSATIYTFTNFGGVQAKGGWRIEYSLETNTWTPVDDTGSGDIALTSDMDAVNHKITNLADGVNDGDAVNAKQIKKLDNIKIGKNLFNKNDVTIGYVNDSGGVNDTSTNYRKSDYIEVLQNTDYTGEGQYHGFKFVAFYDSTKTFISGINGNAAPSNFTTPANTKYLIVTVYVGEIDSFQLEIGNTATDYEAFGYHLDPHSYQQNPIKADEIEDLSGSGLVRNSSKKYDVITDDVTAKLENGKVAVKRISNENVENKAFDVETANYLKFGKNLFCKETGTDGYYLAEDGIPVSYASYGYTDFIKVEEGETYTGWDGSYGMRKTCYYDADKNVVAGGSGVDVTTFTAPAGVAYVRVTYYMSGKETFQFEKGATATDYEEYTSYLEDEGKNKITIREVEEVNISNADKIAFGGCSFTESAWAMKRKSWINKLSQLLDYVVVNYGESGNRIVEITDRIRNNIAKYNSLNVGIRDLKPKYFAMGNIGNESVDAANGLFSDLYREEVKEFIEAAKSIGSFSILSTDHRIDHNQLLSALLRQIAKENQTLYHDIGTIGEKIVNLTDYPDFAGGSHPGTRTNAHTFLEWLWFLAHLPRPDKSIKIFRKRTPYQVSSIDDLNYDDNIQRAIRWQEIQVGETSLDDVSEGLYDRLTDPSVSHVVRHDEYISLYKKQSISFPDYALFDIIIPKVKPSEVKIKITGTFTSPTFYLKDNNNPNTWESTSKMTAAIFKVTKTVWDSLSGINIDDEYTTSDFNDGTNPITLKYKGKYFDYNVGYIIGFEAVSGYIGRNTGTAGTLTRQTGSGNATIDYTELSWALRHSLGFISTVGKPEGKLVAVTPEIIGSDYYISIKEAKYISFDKVKLVVSDTAAFSITDINVFVYNGIEKPKLPIHFTEKKWATELMTYRGFGTDWETTGGWTNNGATLKQVDPAYDNYPSLLSTYYHIALGYNSDDTPNYISRTISVGSKGGFRTAYVRVVARLFPLIYTGADGTWTTSVQQITPDSYDMGMLCLGLKLSGNEINVLRKPVDIGWAEHYFEVEIPPFVDSFELRLFRDPADIIDKTNFKNHTFELQVYDVSVQIEG